MLEGFRVTDDFVGQPNCSRGQVYAMRCNWVRPPSSPPGRTSRNLAEDCLFLNIWTPATDNQKRPVMFYSHGGGFVIGSGGSAAQDGTNLARTLMSLWCKPIIA